MSSPVSELESWARTKLGHDYTSAVADVGGTLIIGALWYGHQLRRAEYMAEGQKKWVAFQPTPKEDSRSPACTWLLYNVENEGSLLIRLLYTDGSDQRHLVKVVPSDDQESLRKSIRRQYRFKQMARLRSHGLSAHTVSRIGHTVPLTHQYDVYLFVEQIVANRDGDIDEAFQLVQALKDLEGERLATVLPAVPKAHNIPPSTLPDLVKGMVIILSELSGKK